MANPAGQAMRTTVLLLTVLIATVPAAAAPLRWEAPAGLPLAGEAAALAEALRVAEPDEAFRLAAAQAGLDVAPLQVPARSLEASLAFLAARAGAVPSAEEWARLRADLDASPALEAPLARVLGAVAVALELRDRAFAALTAQEQAFLAEHAALPLLGEGAYGATMRTADIPAPALPSAFSAADRARAEALAARLDVASLAEAESVLLEASMQALPALREAAALMPPVTQPQSHTCAPGFGTFLCVDQAGSDTWETSYWVAIDLAGSDTYANNQGSAGPAYGIFVAVLIDVAGTDTYSASVGGAATTTLVTQGSGQGGVGLLLDAAGSDTYLASVALTPPDLTNPAPSASVFAQGAGVSGAGALVDLQGPNTFTAAASTLGGAALTIAQGATSTGAGLLVASGGESLAVPGSKYKASSASGMLLTVNTTVGTGTFKQWATGAATTIAQGATGTVGAAGLVDPSGNDEYVATSNGAFAITSAQGAHATAAGVVFVDGEGRDFMNATAVADPLLEFSISLSCPAGFNCIGNATVLVDVATGSAQTFAHAGSDSGASLFADLGSSAGTHNATALSTPKAKASAALVGPGTWIAGPSTFTKATANVTGGDATVRAQGYDRTGSATMVSGTGADVHEIRAVTSAIAEATATGAPGGANFPSAKAVAGSADGKGQGWGQTGAGVLLEQGGDDAYLVIEASSASALLNGVPGGTAIPGTLKWEGRGAAPSIGLGALLDLGGTDTYSSTPPAGDAEGANNTCWTNAPPSLPGNFNLGIGIDTTGVPLPGSCGLIPPN